MRWSQLLQRQGFYPTVWPRRIAENALEDARPAVYAGSVVLSIDAGLNVVDVACRLVPARQLTMANARRKPIDLRWTSMMTTRRFIARHGDADSA